MTGGSCCQPRNAERDAAGRLTQWDMLRPSFVPATAIRALRDFTGARSDLVREGPGYCSGWKTPWRKITSVVKDVLKGQVGNGRTPEASSAQAS